MQQQSRPGGPVPPASPADGSATETTPTQARQGVMPHVTRYVLAIGLGLAVVAMILAYAFGVF